MLQINYDIIDVNVTRKLLRLDKPPFIHDIKKTYDQWIPALFNEVPAKTGVKHPHHTTWRLFTYFSWYLHLGGFLTPI